MYAAVVDSQRLTFEVECVWRRNMIVRDRETGSLWQHATGEALIGPLQGTRLEMLGGELMKWSAWKQIHGHTLAAREPKDWEGLFPRYIISKLLENATRSKTVPGLTPGDTRLPAHEPVVGILVEGMARAYPLRLLKQLGVIEEQFNGRYIQLQYDAAADQVSASSGDTILRCQRMWWMGWFEFHPQTSVFEAGKIDYAPI